MSLWLDKSGVARGEAVTGKVIFWGREKEHSLRHLSLTIFEVDPRSETNELKQRHSVTLAEAFTLAPREKREFPFSSHCRLICT